MDAIQVLLTSHNEGADYPAFERPALVIVTCMDHRIRLRLPENFAYVLRTGGANPRPVEAYLGYAAARAGIQTLALIAHTDCAMRRPDPGAVAGLPLPPEDQAALQAEITALAVGEPGAFARREAARLARRFGFRAVPLLYSVEDHRITPLAPEGT